MLDSGIDARLRALCGTHPAIADWYRATRTGPTGQPLQVLYVVPVRARPTEDWRDALAAILAEAGLPWWIVTVSALPLDAAGDIDLQALAAIPLIDSALADSAGAAAAHALGVECAGLVVSGSLGPSPYHASALLPPSRHRAVRQHAALATGPATAAAIGPAALVDGGELPVDPQRPRLLIETLEAAARSATGALIVRTAQDAEIRLCYAELLARAAAGAAQLRGRKLPSGAPVLLQFEDLLDFFEAFWACIGAGLVPIPSATLQIEQPGAAERLRAIWESLGRIPVLTQRALGDALGAALSDPGAAPDLIVLERSQTAPASDLYRGNTDDIALMMMTSGSTGTPKAVPLSHHNLISRSLGSQLAHGFGATLRSLNWMPLDHVAGLIYFHLRDVYLGAIQVHVPTAAILRDPLRWLDLCEHYKAQVTFAPNFAFGLINARGADIVRRHWDLSQLGHVLNGAEAIVARTAREFMRLLLPHGLPRKAMIPAWGMAEVSSGITYHRDFDIDTTRDDDRHVAVGRPIHGTRLRIVDSEDCVLPESTEGRLQVQGETTFKGYWNLQDESMFTADGWFRTGDLAYIESGRLFITGREKDIINIGGINYPGPAIEAAVDAVPGVVPSFSAAFAVSDPLDGNERLALAFVPEYDRDSALRALLPAIRRRVATQLGITPDLLLPLNRAQVPKTSIGKIQRRQMQASYAAGQFDLARRRLELLTGTGDSIPRWFYRRVWRAKSPRVPAPVRPGPLLYLGAEAGLAERLRAALRGERAVIVAPADAAALMAVCADIHPALVVLPLARMDEAGDAEFRAGVATIVALAGALGSGSQECRLIAATVRAAGVDAGEAGDARAAALAVLARTIGQELAGVAVVHVDADELEPALIDAIRNGDDGEVAWRRGRRLVPLLDQADIVPLAQGPIVVGGNYLVSGGGGGIGRLLVDRLIDDFGARVVVLGRRDEAELDPALLRWLQRRRAEHALAYAAADVCDANAVEAALAALGPPWTAPLDGVFHLAATYHEARVAAETVEAVVTAIATKVDGARVLYRRLARRPDAFFVGFSSLLGDLVGAEVGTYAAASRALEHAVAALAAAGGPRCYCLDWASWRATGLSQGRDTAGALGARGVLEMEPRQALNSLLAVLGQAPGTWLVGLNPESMSVARRVAGVHPLQRIVVAACHPETLPPALEIADVAGVISRFELIPVAEFPRTADGAIDSDALTLMLQADSHAHVEPRDVVEARLKQIWQVLLGIDRISVEDSFFDLGGGSLIATQLLGAIESAFACRWSMRDIFAAPTIAAQAARVRGVAAASVDAAIRPRPPDLAVLPLSSAQRRMWLADRIDPGDPLWNIHARMTWHRRIDAQALGRALWALGARHESLRTTFALRDGEPLQEVSAEPLTLLATTDLSGVPGAQRAAAARRIAEAEARFRFDLTQGPLFRAQLLRLTPDRDELLLTTHHIVADGWSMRVLFDELRALYEAEASGVPAAMPELPIHYADYALWQRENPPPARVAAHLDFWLAQLRGVTTGTVLRGDRPRPALRSSRGAQLRVPLPQALQTAMESARQRLGVSATAWLFACFAVLLRRWSGDPDVTVGTVVANRAQPQTHDLIGMFANLAVLRLAVDDRTDFARLAASARELLLAIEEHTELPFETLLERGGFERDPRFAPLFQVAFDVRDARLSDSGDADIELEVMGRDIGRVQYDLHLTIEPGRDGTVAIWSYNADLFDVATVERLAAAYVQIANAAATDPGLASGRLPLLAAAERERLLCDFNANDIDLPRACVHEQFVAQARLRPAAVALRYGGHDLCYGELERHSARVAAALSGAGVRRHDLVAVMIEPGFELIAALLGVLRSGAAFVPIDAAYPPERIAHILSDSGCRTVLVSTATRAQVGATQAIEIAAALATADAAPAVTVAPEDLAYLIYTSGSTGTPKGVLIEHRGLANLAGAQVAALAIEPASRVLQFSSIGFDAAVWEIFATLAAGATLVLGSRETLLPGPPLAEFLRAEKVSIATLVPSVLQVLPPERLPDLRLLVSAGEPLSAELARLWAAGRRMINAYGPTETTVCATLGQVDPTLDRAPDIGMPLANCRVYLLDANGEPVPVGVDGEICIGGPGVARGYHRRPDLTGARFGSDPYAREPGARLFRTGDFGRWRADGRIEFLGRRDEQVKVRGVRVEIAEIEAALSRIPGVAAAVVTPDPRAVGVELVAFVATAGANVPRVIDADGLRAELARALPPAMIPAQFHFIDVIPYAPSGKADRRALLAGLPASYATRSTSAATPGAGGSLEVLIAAVWCAVLEREQVDHHANFFDIGGHSLKVAAVNAELQRRLEREIPLIDHFRFPTVATLARHLRGDTGADSRAQAEAGAERSEHLQQGRAQLAELRRRRQHTDRES